MSIVPSSFDITTMASLIDLFPYDVILSVFMFMNLKSLIICREVCRGFKDLIDADLRLQYHIALDAAGMENGPPSWMDIKERKDRLQSYVSRCQGFVWQQGTLLPPLPGPILHWVIDSGVIGRFYDAGNGVYGMHFSRLPARSRNIIQKGWQIGNIGHNATAFCLDPSQDLLVVAEVIPAGNPQAAQQSFLYMRGLTNGCVHPSACADMWKFAAPAGPEVADGSVWTIRVLGHLIGILVNADKPEFIVYDWKSDRIVMWVWSSSFHIDGFVFLNERFILLSIPSSPGNLDVFDMHHTPTVRTLLDDVESFCTFEYPESRMPVVCCIDSTSGCTSGGTLDVPFFPAPSSIVYVVRLEFDHTRFGQHPDFWRDPVGPITHFIPASVILSRLQRGNHWTWSEWGPQETHLEGNMIVPVGTVKNAQRFAFLTHTLMGHPVLEVYDFGGSRRPGVAATEAQNVSSMLQRYSVEWPMPEGHHERTEVLPCGLQYTRKAAIMAGFSDWGQIGAGVDVVTCDDGVVFVREDPARGFDFRAVTL